MSCVEPNLDGERGAVAFPTLDADLCDGVSERGGTAKRVCIATPDILGPVKNGGIGTAYHHLARLLAEWGHEVVIAFVAGNAADVQLMDETRAFYSELDVALGAHRSPSRRQDLARSGRGPELGTLRVAAGA